MNQFTVKPVSNAEKAVGENRNQKQTEASIWKQVIEAMILTLKMGLLL